MMIIGLIGKSQVGKTTASDYAIQEFDKLTKLSFATPLKDMLVRAGICSYHEVFEEKTWFSRSLLQLIGTNLIREQIDPNFWINKIKERITHLSFAENTVIIDDIRFKNEAEFIRNSNGVLLRITRPSVNSVDKHRSETELDEIIPNTTIVNNGTLIEYKKNVLSVVRSYL